MSQPAVLFVDDEPQVLNAIRRSLRNDFAIETSNGSKQALALLETGQRFSVIVSDFRMPEMDGIELLQRVCKIAPLTVKVLLTGNTDQETAVRAVNDGDIFRFLNKPCDPTQLKNVLRQGIRHYELLTAERELLERTLRGCIEVLGDLLGIVKPESFGRSDRLRRKARELAAHLDGVDLWQLDTAALLSQLGCVNVPEKTLAKVVSGEALGKDERTKFNSHPLLTADLIGRIPRMDQIAKIILYQNKQFNGTGFPADNLKGDAIPLESRVLHMVLAYDELTTQGLSEVSIIEKIRSQKSRFDPSVLAALESSIDLSSTRAVTRLMPSEMHLGMVVEEDVNNSEGVMLLCRGQKVTPAIIDHLLKFERRGSITRAILVSKPDQSEIDRSGA